MLKGELVKVLSNKLATKEVLLTSVNDARHGIDETLTDHTTVDKLVELIDVVPAAIIIRLNITDPIEETRNPFQFLMFLTRTDCLWIPAEVDIGISTLPSLIGCSLPQEVVELFI